MIGISDVELFNIVPVRNSNLILYSLDFFITQPIANPYEFIFCELYIFCISSTIMIELRSDSKNSLSTCNVPLLYELRSSGTF